MMKNKNFKKTRKLFTNFRTLKGNFMTNKLKEVPIFTATDDNYIPFLAVTLESMRENCSPDYKYVVKVLNSGISAENIEKIKKYESDNISVDFVDVTPSLSKLEQTLHTCIYYTKVTYYRLFITSLFPNYDKALYLDPDIVIRSDVADLYNIDIGNNLVGATTDEFVANWEKVQPYISKGLGFSTHKNYFNAGVLVMNLKEMRRQGFEEQFIDLLAKYKFVVQDQDYLNVMCKDQVHYISGLWDKMPCTEDVDVKDIHLIHYNLIWKPWHAEVPYGDEFWKYVDMTEFKDYIHNIRDNYSAEKYKKDVDNFNGFMDMIVAEGENPNNYYNTFIKPKDEDEGFSGFQFVQTVMANI